MSAKMVCVPCRKVYADRGLLMAWCPGVVFPTAPSRCPQCHGDLVAQSYRWRAPKRRNNRAWKRIESGDWLWENDTKDAVSWYDRFSPGNKKRNKSLTQPKWRNHE